MWLIYCAAYLKERKADMPRMTDTPLDCAMALSKQELLRQLVDANAEIERLQAGTDDAGDAATLTPAMMASDRDRWHRVAMEAGAVTCEGVGHIYPLRDEVKKLRAEVARLTSTEPQQPTVYAVEAIYQAIYRANGYALNDGMAVRNAIVRALSIVAQPPSVAAGGEVRTFDIAGTTLRRVGKVLTVTCDSDEIANRVADQLRSVSPQLPREPSASELVAWFRGRPGTSWEATIRDIEKAVGALAVSRPESK